jgi:hypothetical protein
VRRLKPTPGRPERGVMKSGEGARAHAVRSASTDPCAPDEDGIRREMEVGNMLITTGEQVPCRGGKNRVTRWEFVRRGRSD